MTDYADAARKKDICWDVMRIPAQRMITISFMRRSGTIWFLCESRISI